MAETEGRDQSQSDAAPEGRVQVTVWDYTQARPLTDVFAIELVGHETWKPAFDTWEVKHTFTGLTPGDPYALRIHIGDPGADPLELRFWAVEPEAWHEQVPDYLIEPTDDFIRVLHPGIRASERNYPRPVQPSAGKRINQVWNRWGGAIIIGVVLGISGLLYLISALSGDEGEAQTDPLPWQATVTPVVVTFQATRLDGSQEMLVQIENESGGTEEHVIDAETWQITRAVDPRISVWMDVQNLSDLGAVRCELIVNDEAWVTATSTGPNVTASCWGNPEDGFE